MINSAKNDFWTCTTSEEKTLKKIYDGVAAVLNLSSFFENINGLEIWSSSLSHLSQTVDSYETFFRHFWVIRKWTMFYIVTDTKYRWLYTETLEVFDEQSVVACFSSAELNNARAHLDQASHKYKNDINWLIWVKISAERSWLGVEDMNIFVSEIIKAALIDRVIEQDIFPKDLLERLSLAYEWREQLIWMSDGSVSGNYKWQTVSQIEDKFYVYYEEFSQEELERLCMIYYWADSIEEVVWML